MESYLTGRGYQDPAESKDSSFQGFLEGQEGLLLKSSMDTPKRNPRKANHLRGRGMPKS